MSEPDIPIEVLRPQSARGCVSGLAAMAVLGLVLAVAAWLA